MSSSEEQLKAALAECARLKAENASFRSILAAHGQLPKPAEDHPVAKSLESSTGIHNGSPPRESCEAAWDESSGAVPWSPLLR